MAQSRQSAYNIGFLGGQTKIVNGEDSAYYVITGGQVIQSGATEVVQDEHFLAVGFPYPVAYFNTTFDEEFFVSKGYFPDVVQLNWSIISSGDNITRLLIYRKPLGSDGDSLLVATLAPDEFSFRDEFVEGGILYKYTLFAEGVADELRIPFVNFIESSGFAFPVGTATGRITFEGGTAVNGATVLAETEGNLRGRSLRVSSEDESYLRFFPGETDDELEVDGGLTFQVWTRFEGDDGVPVTIFNRGDIELDYDGATLNFAVGDATASLAYTHPTDSFFHVSAVFDPVQDYLAVYARKNVREIDSVRVAAGSAPAIPEGAAIYIGRNEEGNFYSGFVDEIRYWNRPLAFDEIDRDFSRFLAGTEDGFAAYWRLNAGVAEEFYDFSRQGGFDFNENHGQIIRAEWSDETPLNSQLSYKGITDESGNYTITGFPFETQGSLYTFTPIFENHTFEPTQQLRFVGDGAFIFNEVDFDDVSSFPVSGTIFYQNTPFPVEGAFITVDGIPAVNADGDLILSDALGAFTIDVPIGFHSIRVELQDHTFEDGGRFPPATPDDEFPLFNFQEPIAGLVFQDTTLVRLAGRVTGGPLEVQQPMGFGRSNNNIGQASIRLSPQKIQDLTFREFDSLVVTTDALGVDEFTSTATINLREVEIAPDPESGEFVIMLPPERYVVNDVRAGIYDFDETFNTTLDLTGIREENEFLQDTVLIEVAGEPIGIFPPVDPAAFDTIFTSQVADTLFTIAVDTFYFDHKKDFTLRLTPTISVVNLEGEEIFGEESLNAEDETTGITTEVPLIDGDGNYTFGFPVFLQRGNYSFRIELFEEYINDALVDQVPVVDGEVAITNNLAINDDEVRIPLNARGKATYSFLGGIPNINQDEINPENSFTSTLNITAFSGNNGAIQTIWREGDPFRGYVFGGIPTGNNFVTTGPNQIDMILRDPPGSESFASIEQGVSYSSASEVSVTNTQGTAIERELQLGATIETSIGLGAEVTTEVEVSNTTTAGFDVTTSFNSNSEIANSIEFTEIISTSDAPEFVGAQGDLFVGRSTNIVYGLSSFIELIPDDQCTDCLETSVDGFRIGTDVGLRLNPEFSTGFVFSQFFIQDVLIPDLEQLRNEFITYVSDPADVVPIDEPVYVSLVPPEDERFGSSNTDASVWGTDASTIGSFGPSYQLLFPADYEGSRTDTVMFFNQSIEDWIFWLTFNERQKFEAEVIDNRSFEAGSVLEQSVTITASESVETNFEFNLDQTIANELGFEVNDNGFSETISFNTSTSFGRSSSSAVEESTSFSFTLADGDLGDAYTVDIREAGDGFGPVFSTRGGATSCPYEDEVLTQFYRPGEILSAATAQREVPVLTVDQSVVSEVPGNRPAVFTLNLQNNSETMEGFQMELDIVDGTNPFGAIIEVDGTPLANGLVFQVVPGQSLVKTLTLAQGQESVTDYENIGIVLRSLCQSDPNDNQVDIQDEVSISAFFIPGCSDVAIEMPTDQWVLNTRAAQEGVVTVNIADYDLNFDRFERVDLQYKPASGSQWITDMRFYNPLMVTSEEFEDKEEPKQMIDGSEITYDFDMGDLPDREYDVRAVSRCVLAPGEEVFTPSEILRGTKDTSRPQLFGAPQPADGVLSANDEILIQFDEPIESGLINNSTLSIKAVLNDSELNNGTSVGFDGINDYVRVPVALDLSGRSFTVFSWLRRNTFNETSILFSTGNNSNDVFEYGFNDDNRFFVNFSGQIIETALSFPEPSEVSFEHIAVVYNRENQAISAYRNGEFILEDVKVTNTYSGTGPVTLGRSEVTNDRYFNGNMHELRIWSEPLSISDVVANANRSLIGNEVGLVGYWPFDEAFGNLATDKARFRNAVLFAEWNVEPGGYALTFDGLDDYLEINTSSTVAISDERDFSIEFWFKGAPGQGESVLFSNGKGDGTDERANSDNTWFVGFNANEELVVSNNTSEIIASSGDGQYLDNDWHHFAMAVSRRGNINVLVDLELKASIPSGALGGLQGNRMWLGVRGFRSTNRGLGFDRYFEGSIDEFRIWETFRRNTQLELNWNSRLIGDETGLVAYYPFETFEIVNGVNLLNSSLEDQFDNEFGDNGGLATAVGGTDFNGEDTPNIRLSRPVASVDFDFAVSDDAIVLTPSGIFAPLIEQTTLEISLRTVEDRFENRLASPVSWTAFVDRNQVKWGDDRLAFTKDVNDPLSFVVDITNFGGTEQNFSINNLPPWLTAMPQSGEIAPQSTIAIQLEVNTGLNIGGYEEDIFLSADLGFNEKLTLVLDVLGAAPKWNVNPADFQFSMNVVGELEVEGVLSADEDDIIGVFVNDEVRGVASPIYVRDLDRYLAFLDIYANQGTGESLEFRVWDASKGVEHREVAPELTFNANELEGTPLDPIRIVAGDVIVQNIDLVAGFNWISFSTNSAQLADINELMTPLSPITGDQIKGQEVVDIYTDGFGWKGSLSNTGGAQNGDLYLIRIDNPGTLDVVGTQVKANTSIPITPGWNWIGYIPDFNLSVDEAFNSLSPSAGDIVKGQFAFSVFEEGIGWEGTLNFLEPNQGYLYFATDPGRLVYPANTFLNRQAWQPNVAPSERWSGNLHGYASNMSVIAELADSRADSVVLGAFVDGHYRGGVEAKKVQGRSIFFLTIMGLEEGERVQLKLKDLSNDGEMDLANALQFSSNELLGSIDQPLQLRIGAPQDAPSGERVWPNPSAEAFHVAFHGFQGRVTIAIRNLLGELIGRFEMQSDDAKSWTWPAQVEPGVYIINISDGEHAEDIKVIKL